MPIRTDLLFEHFPGYERGFKPAERFVQDLDHALGAGPIRNVGEGFGDRFPEEKGPYPVREPIVFDCGDKRVPTAEILAAMGNVKPVPPLLRLLAHGAAERRPRAPDHAPG